MKLDQVVPWGRNYDEYLGMFALPGLNPGDRVLGCADGPASFNAEATARGIEVTSADPTYRFDKPALTQRIEAARSQIMAQVRASPDDYLWTSIPNADELEHRRMSAMQRFLEDYPAGLVSGRYIDASLPRLPFDDASFDYGLCANLLFLYSSHLDEAFHIDSAIELCRVAREVRIYPLVSMPDNQRSPHLPAVLAALRAARYTVEEVDVTYRFQMGAVSMLRIRRE